MTETYWTRIDGGKPRLDRIVTDEPTRLADAHDCIGELIEGFCMIVDGLIGFIACILLAAWEWRRK